MKKTSLRFVLASCVLGFLPASSQAQQGQPEQPNPAAPQPAQESPNQQAIPDADQKEDDQRIEARRIDPSAASQQGQKSVQDYLVAKLMLGNKHEIELSQMATEKAQNQDVKQYAQRMVQDHRQLNEQLQQLKSDKQGRQASAQNQRGASQDRDRGDSPRRQQVAQPDRDSTAGDQDNSGDRPRLSRDEQQTRISVGDRSGQKVPQELTRVSQQAAGNHMQMVKQMLQEKKGQEFDMAFMGMQIAGHTLMVAELQAMQDVGSQEFQQLVSQAEQTTSEHLDQAKQLAKKLKGDHDAASQGSESDAQPLRRGGANDNRGSN